MDDDGLPDVSTVDEVLAEMERLATECRDAVDDVALSPLLERAFTLMLEIRVPRMPDTDDELARMLSREDDGPTYTTEEVMADLKEHGRRFRNLSTRFRALARSGEGAEAARMLSSDGALVRWEADCRPEVTWIVGWHSAVLRIGGTTVEGEAPTTGAAILSALLRAHTLREIWLR